MCDSCVATQFSTSLAITYFWVLSSVEWHLREGTTVGSQDHRGLWTHRAYQVGAKRTGRRERGMERVQGKLGDSGEGEREIPVSVFLFFLLCLPVSLCLSFCICFMSLLLCPRHYYLFFISSFSDISPSGFIILTVSLLSVRHEESREGSADFTNFFFWLH